MDFQDVFRILIHRPLSSLHINRTRMLTYYILIYPLKYAFSGAASTYLVDISTTSTDKSIHCLWLMNLFVASDYTYIEKKAGLSVFVLMLVCWISTENRWLLFTSISYWHHDRMSSLELLEAVFPKFVCVLFNLIAHWFCLRDVKYKTHMSSRDPTVHCARSQTHLTWIWLYHTPTATTYSCLGCHIEN